MIFVQSTAQELYFALQDVRGREPREARRDRADEARADAVVPGDVRARGRVRLALHVHGDPPAQRAAPHHQRPLRPGALQERAEDRGPRAPGTSSFTSYLPPS